MHQQIRLKLGVMSVNDGTGAMTAMPIEVDPIEVRRSLLDLLDTLADAGFDLRMVAGRNIETTGEFVFAVADEETFRCYELLRDRGFRNIRVVEPKHGHAAPGPGGLAAALREMAIRGPIHEIFIGIEEDGQTPIQVTTVTNAIADTTA